MLSRGLPQRPLKGFSNVFSSHVSASEVREANHVPLLSLSSLKDWRRAGCDMIKKTRCPSHREGGKMEYTTLAEVSVNQSTIDTRHL